MSLPTQGRKGFTSKRRTKRLADTANLMLSHANSITTRNRDVFAPDAIAIATRWKANTSQMARSA